MNLNLPIAANRHIIPKNAGKSAFLLLFLVKAWRSKRFCAKIVISYIRLYLHMSQIPYNSGRHKPIAGRLALYQLVTQRILQQLADGQIKAGQYLPSEWDLAQSWQVSQGTIRKALNDLVACGVLVRQQGVGTLVTHKNLDWGDYPLSAAPAAMADKATLIWPAAEVLSVTLDAADSETAVQLGLRLTESVWKVVVIWRNGYQVVALDEAFLPTSVLPDLNIHFIHRRAGFYAFLLQQYQVILMTRRQWLWTQHIETENQRLLKCSHADSCLCWGRLSGGADGVLLEWRRRFLNLGDWALQTAGLVTEA